MSGKTKKHRRKKKGADNQTGRTANRPKRFWHEILDTNKIVAGATVAAVIVAIATIYFSNRSSSDELHRTHRPNVIFDRPLEILEPFKCDPRTGQGSVSIRAWFKNDGNANAAEVFPDVHPLIVPATPDGTKEVQSTAGAFCKKHMPTTGIPGFQLAQNTEMHLDMGPMTMGTSKPSGTNPINVFVVACLYYGDEYSIPHRDCLVETLGRPGGGNFVCGQSMDGTLSIWPLGSCTD